MAKGQGRVEGKPVTDSRDQGSIRVRTACVPRSDDAEDPVDPKPEIEENCKPKCVKQLLQYQACTKRVEDDDTGSKHCTGQYFDYWGCIDKCAATKLFNKLK
ncbi:hypothetical protein AXG93_2225s1050 [Marchantia polymorpha subsp. ruderalis]|uniref:Complex III subunit VI n=1 Tax=Marchantia polymorpha subsp. ruderalis TaxID=1480154 RepID=A0A176W3C5_MARPO|nr:hypothetical protein AXG93_2225s1050 [Marchantia polymorpha subsp. ruderalis]